MAIQTPSQQDADFRSLLGNNKTSHTSLHIPHTLIRTSHTTVQHTWRQSRMSHTQCSTQHPLSWVPNPWTTLDHTIRVQTCSKNSRIRRRTFISHSFTERGAYQRVQSRMGWETRQSRRRLASGITRVSCEAICILMLRNGYRGSGTAQLAVLAIFSAAVTVIGRWHTTPERVVRKRGDGCRAYVVAGGVVVMPLPARIDILDYSLCICSVIRSDRCHGAR